MLLDFYKFHSKYVELKSLPVYSQSVQKYLSTGLNYISIICERVLVIGCAKVKSGN